MKRLLMLISLVPSLTLSLMGQGAVDSSKMERTAPENQVQKGSLFSAISFTNTPLGRRWAALRPEAEGLFPSLKMKTVSDLHVTIIYIGKDWEIGNLDLLRKVMAVQVTDTILLTPEIASLGRNNQVVAVELKGIPDTLQQQIVAVKAKLNAAGLKKPESYDASFRAHVTLAESKENPPTEQQERELRAFQEWIVPHLDLLSLHLHLDPSMPIRFMLAGATRPTPLPEYITLENFLENSW